MNRSRPPSWIKWLIIPIASLLLVLLLATGAFLFYLSGNPETSHVRPGGTFETAFSGDFYHRPDGSLTDWFNTNFSGTDQASAGSLWNQSFSEALEPGEWMTIEQLSSLAGGRHLKVKLNFDAGGKFVNAQVDLRFAFL